MTAMHQAVYPMVSKMKSAIWEGFLLSFKFYHWTAFHKQESTAKCPFLPGHRTHRSCTKCCAFHTCLQPGALAGCSLPAADLCHQGFWWPSLWKTWCHLLLGPTRRVAVLLIMSPDRVICPPDHKLQQGQQSMPGMFNLLHDLDRSCKARQFLSWKTSCTLKTDSHWHSKKSKFLSPLQETLHLLRSYFMYPHWQGTSCAFVSIHCMLVVILTQCVLYYKDNRRLYTGVRGWRSRVLAFPYTKVCSSSAAAWCRWCVQKPHHNFSTATDVRLLHFFTLIQPRSVVKDQPHHHKSRVIPCYVLFSILSMTTRFLREYSEIS